ncbi:MAG: S8 family serine peptidase [Fimbriimonadaceae bacterium]
MNRTLTALALASICSVSFAQTARVPRVGANSQIRFVEVPNYMEFTGQMIVRPKQADQLARAGVSDLSARLMRQQVELEMSEYMIEYRGPNDEYIIQLPEGENENSFARRFLATGRYQYVEPDWRVFPAYTPNDPQLGNQWSHTNSDSRAGWDVQRGSTSVIVGITDTGVHLTHEDFNNPASNLVSGYNAASNQTQAAGGQVQDINGHGTHCAGIAAAIGNNSRGVAGVNLTGTKIMPVRVTNSSGGGSSISWLTGGILWAAQNGARSVSTSYSGYNSASVGTTGTTLKNTYNALSHWAAGNSGAFISGADHVNVVIVGATNSANGRASFSNYGTDTDLFAPGDFIRSTYWTGAATNTYADLSGTSMACPFAAGLSALIMCQNPTYSAQQVEDVLYKSCIDMGNTTNFGWGRVNVSHAMGKVPNSFTIVRGLLQAGGTTDMYRVEGNVLRVRRGLVVNAGEAPIQVQTPHAAAFATPSEVNVQLTSSVNTGGLSRRIELLNRNTGVYDVIGSGAATTSMTKLEATVSGANAANYVNGGIVTARVAVYQTGPTTISQWETSIDQLVVRTLR